MYLRFGSVPGPTSPTLLSSAASHRESLVSQDMVAYLVSLVTLEMKASRALLEKRYLIEGNGFKFGTNQISVVGSLKYCFGFIREIVEHQELQD